jgi:hypothetical protein
MADKKKLIRQAGGKQAGAAGGLKGLVGGSAGGVDIRAIRRMMDWQLELLERQRVLTMSVLEIVGGGKQSGL